MYFPKSLLIAALLSTVVATPLQDRAVDAVDVKPSIELRSQGVTATSNRGNGDCGNDEMGRLESEIRNRQEMKDRLDGEIRRREDMKARLDEEIRRKQQNGGCGYNN